MDQDQNQPQNPGTPQPPRKSLGQTAARSRKKLRFRLVVAGLLLLGGATALVLTAFQDSIVFFYGPSDIAKQAIGPDVAFRLGGLVKEGSVEKASDGVETRFIVTDLSAEVGVSYRGILPDLFREGQGVVALGSLDGQGLFIAQEVLAKHDENYIPAEVVEAMKRAGTWQEEGAPGATPAEPEKKPESEPERPVY